MQKVHCDKEKKDLLAFLLFKTAPVRSGMKPGELLRVKNCYYCRSKDSYCLLRKDVLEELNLSYIILREDNDGALVLFHNKEMLMATLRQSENEKILLENHYSFDKELKGLLLTLRNNFQHRVDFPHEIGIFIGYPAKDVQGFIDNAPRTPVEGGAWAVFGDAGESLTLMKLYRNIEECAKKLLHSCDDLQTFFNKINNFCSYDKNFWLQN